jgi:hypothetical protein
MHYGKDAARNYAHHRLQQAEIPIDLMIRWLIGNPIGKPSCAGACGKADPPGNLRHPDNERAAQRSMRHQGERKPLPPQVKGKGMHPAQTTMHSAFVVLDDVINSRVFAHKISHGRDTHNTDRAPGFFPSQHL